MKVAPYYWQGDGASIYMVGNPIIWWGTSVLFFGLLIQLVLMRPLGTKLQPPVRREPRVWLPLAGYALSFLPFFRVTRVLFLYHYFTPLVFSLAFVPLYRSNRMARARCSASTRRSRSSLRRRSFLAISPLTYGFRSAYDEGLRTHDRGGDDA
jgi:dolichyl-phosphate-mannose--protein O-mannosyl transferase